MKFIGMSPALSLLWSMLTEKGYHSVNVTYSNWELDDITKIQNTYYTITADELSADFDMIKSTGDDDSFAYLRIDRQLRLRTFVISGKPKRYVDGANTTLAKLMDELENFDVKYPTNAAFGPLNSLKIVRRLGGTFGREARLFIDNGRLRNNFALTNTTADTITRIQTTPFYQPDHPLALDHAINQILDVAHRLEIETFDMTGLIEKFALEDTPSELIVTKKLASVLRNILSTPDPYRLTEITDYTYASWLGIKSSRDLPNVLETLFRMAYAVTGGDVRLLDFFSGNGMNYIFSNAQVMNLRDALVNSHNLNDRYKEFIPNMSGLMSDSLTFPISAIVKLADSSFLYLETDGLKIVRSYHAPDLATLTDNEDIGISHRTLPSVVRKVVGEHPGDIGDTTLIIESGFARDVLISHNHRNSYMGSLRVIDMISNTVINVRTLDTFNGIKGFDEIMDESSFLTWMESFGDNALFLINFGDGGFSRRFPVWLRSKLHSSSYTDFRSIYYDDVVYCGFAIFTLDSLLQVEGSSPSVYKVWRDPKGAHAPQNRVNFIDYSPFKTRFIEHKLQQASPEIKERYNKYEMFRKKMATDPDLIARLSFAERVSPKTKIVDQILDEAEQANFNVRSQNDTGAIAVGLVTGLLTGTLPRFFR